MSGHSEPNLTTSGSAVATPTAPARLPLIVGETYEVRADAPARLSPGSGSRPGDVVVGPSPDALRFRADVAEVMISAATSSDVRVWLRMVEPAASCSCNRPGVPRGCR